MVDSASLGCEAARAWSLLHGRLTPTPHLPQPPTRAFPVAPLFISVPNNAEFRPLLTTILCVLSCLKFWPSPFKSSQRATTGKKNKCSILPARRESDTLPSRSERQESFQEGRFCLTKQRGGWRTKPMIGHTRRKTTNLGINLIY